MKAVARISAIFSALAFIGFAADVTAGAFLRVNYLSDLNEMLLLLLAAACFVVLILAREQIAGSGSRPPDAG